MKQWIAMTAFALTGCALTGEELRKSAPARQESSRLTPQTYAECLVREAPNVFFMAQGQVVSATADASDTNIFVESRLWATIQANKTAAGSNITAQLQPGLLGFEQDRALGAMDRCR
jgi:hypothetical protein